MSRRKKRNQANTYNPVPNLDKNHRTVSIEEFKTSENLQRRLYELERLVDELGETWTTVYNHIRSELQVDSVGDEIGSITIQLRDTLRFIRYGNQKHKKSGKLVSFTKITGNSHQHQHQSPDVNGNSNGSGKKNRKNKETNKKPDKNRYCDIKLEFIVACIGTSDLGMEPAKKG